MESQSVFLFIVALVLAAGACLKSDPLIHPGPYTGFGYCCGGEVVEPRGCRPLQGREQHCADAITCKRHVECRPNGEPCVVCSTATGVAAFPRADLPPEAMDP